MTFDLPAFLRRATYAACAATFATAAVASTPGATAPDITAVDTSGKTVKLADQRGKFVVLEWTNPDCPFVQKHYDSKNMQTLQNQWGAKDVVWLTVNSTREGHSEYRTGAQMDSFHAPRINEDFAPRHRLGKAWNQR